MKHQKHAKLKRAAYGQFHRNEWAIIGTPCGNIQKLAAQLAESLTPYNVGYVDADHKSNENDQMPKGVALKYTDKISHHRLDLQAIKGQHQFRQLFNNQDLALVNGNHFKAKAQIVVLDPRKKESLSRKLDRLTDVQLFLTVEGHTKEEGAEVYDFLKKHLPDGEIPIMGMHEVGKISAFLQDKMTKALPPLYGLVLAGGKSQRMGTDKGAIDYHGKPQREYMADLLSNFCEKTWLSCRADQVGTFKSAYPLLTDRFLEMGPFGALLSAFLQAPDAAWLVVACDYPLLDQKTLKTLVGQRDLSAAATAFHSEETGFPEPLVTIWEPRAYPIALQFLAQGYSCPRKVLINSDIHEIPDPKGSILMNANTLEDQKAAINQLKQ